MGGIIINIIFIIINVAIIIITIIINNNYLFNTKKMKKFALKSLH